MFIHDEGISMIGLSGGFFCRFLGCGGLVVELVD